MSTSAAPLVSRKGFEVTLLAEARDAARSGRGAHLRRAAGISQAEMAAAVGVTASCVCRWEAGERRPGGDVAPSYARTLRALAEGMARPVNPPPLLLNDDAPAGNGRVGKVRDAGAQPPE